MNTSSDNPNSIPADVAGLLSRLRRRIRLYVWAEGLAATVIVVGMAFWVGLAVDRFFEPSPRFRVVAMTVVAMLVLAVAYRYIVRRAFARLADSSLALLVERKFEAFHDSLLTSVELAKTGRNVPDASLAMLDHTADDARAQIDSVRLSRVFNFRPLMLSLLAAAMLVASIVAFGLLGREAFGFWMRRIGLTEELWPRTVSLEVDGFTADADGWRVENLARDDTFELTVRAALTDKFNAPDRVEIRYRTADGQRGRDTMTQVGTAIPGRDAHQLYKYTFQDIAGDLTFDIVGGDDRIRDLRLNLVDRPNLVGMRLGCEYPAYMKKSNETLDVTGTVQIPEGTRLVLTATATKPLTKARLHAADLPEDIVLSFNDRRADQDSTSGLAFQLPPLSDDMVLLISLTDNDGVQTRDPIRVAISMALDAPPEVAVRLIGIGSAITADARIPFTGTINDPRYAVDRCWFKFQTNGSEPKTMPFTANVADLQEVRVDEILDARTLDTETKQRILQLAPDQKLLIHVKASDRYDLSDEPHEGSSQPFTLEVVTPDKLRSMLERRELSLRQRFESLVEKTHDTRRLLARVEFSVPANTEETNGDASRLRERRRLRVVGAAQNMAQVAQETLGIAESFDHIQAELVNNRIDTEEMLDRLRDGIAGPLRSIALEQVPTLERQLDVVVKNADNQGDGPGELRKATVLTDEVLVAMQQVLDKMLELESYNEVLDLLRGLVADQDKLNEQTKKRQLERLRGMLE